MTPEESGLQIIGLVCGYPGDRALRRNILMLNAFKAFVDGSGSGNPNLLVIAGYIAPAATWLEFSKEWQRRLDAAGINCFKMSEMAASKMEIAAWFYRAIEESGVTAAISCSIRTDALAKLVLNYPWPPEFGDMREAANPLLFRL